MRNGLRIGQLFGINIYLDWSWLLIFTGIAMIFGVQVPFFGTGFVSGLWLAFIGWFLSSAARQSEQQIVIHDLLEGVPAAQLMRSNVTAVPPTISVGELIYRYVMAPTSRPFQCWMAIG